MALVEGDLLKSFSLRHVQQGARANKHSSSLGVGRWGCRCWGATSSGCWCSTAAVPKSKHCSWSKPFSTAQSVKNVCWTHRPLPTLPCPVTLFITLYLQENVNRLKGYKSNLVVFPRHRNSKKPKVGRFFPLILFCPSFLSPFFLEFAAECVSGGGLGGGVVVMGGSWCCGQWWRLIAAAELMPGWC